MLRISLIIALVAGIAALAVTQLRVAENIKTLTGERDQFKADSERTQKEALDAKKLAKEATAAADQAKKALETAKTELATASEKADLVSFLHCLSDGTLVKGRHSESHDRSSSTSE